METVSIGGRRVSRFILGSNPFSGFSHQGRERDREMIRYYTCARIKAVLREAESLGVNTVIARADFHMARTLLEFWDGGGALQWFGQTCPELGAPEPSLQRVARFGGPACHIHGGYADHLMANGEMERLVPTVKYARDLGLIVGMAGHRTDTIRWAEENLDLDYYMCCYYHPIERKKAPEHRPGTDEKYREVDRQAMTALIQELARPVIHYKIMAAGRNDPAEAFACAARSMRPGDACCVGIYAADRPEMLAEDVALLEESLAAQSQQTPA
jgi:hypothetical protein